ncbi:unnamed protein product, partial [Musa acuminata subsp. burmannicoides]
MMSSNAKLSEFFGPSPNFYPLMPALVLRSESQRSGRGT